MATGKEKQKLSCAESYFKVAKAAFIQTQKMRRVVINNGMKMKKALIATHVSGFVPQFELNNVRTLQELGYEVHYASNFHNVSYGTDNHRLDGTGMVCHQVDFARSPFDLMAHKKAVRQLKNLMQTEEFSLLHCHTPVGAALSRLVAAPYRRSGLKVLYTAHGFHFYKGAPWKYWLLFYPVERFLAGKTDVLITINEEDHERAKHFCRHKQTKVQYLPGVGIDINYWSGKDLTLGKREEIRTCIRQELGVADSEQMLLSVGELIPRKNHERVIRALAEEKKKGATDFHYFICGQGDLKDYLQNLIDTLELSNEVTLLGYRKDIRNLLYGADLFVFPSKQEGMPMALMEAAAAGVSLKASDIRGNREVLRDSGEHAGLPEKYDSSKIKETMKQIYKELQ